MKDDGYGSGFFFSRPMWQKKLASMILRANEYAHRYRNDIILTEVVRAYESFLKKLLNIFISIGTNDYSELFKKDPKLKIEFGLLIRDFGDVIKKRPEHEFHFLSEMRDHLLKIKLYVEVSERDSLANAAK